MKMLKFLRYDLDSKLMSTIITENFKEIRALYDLIFQEKVKDSE